ncbi:thioredoxin domain-containing protein [Ruegeria sp. HKCCD8929]|uniref:thioredoxin domain-containing protein n=1 Tax=Ruegeria sp. HKCCD8929 TaxID=2683006 RepID=UPI001489D655|nr:thioredoxin domain-containing protein [Ruegeria sp. HKCCD8929]
MRPCPIVRAALVLLLGIMLTGSSATAAESLKDAISPYLRAHADDEIEWHPWGEDALRRAKQEQKLIFLSIGYASCHWCHVQARTTFSDPRVISILKDHFVSILVDREERPDLDHHFAAVMSAMTGQQGWPANFFLAPDLTPLFAAGYIAPESEFGTPGLLDVADKLATRWTTDRDAFLKEVEEISSELRALFDNRAVAAGPAQGLSDPRRAATQAWTDSFDAEYGGFGQGQKFLFPNVLSFLLNESVRLDDTGLMEKTLATLDQMAAGGIRDQLGGAFHRYAVDRYWQVPHFEIMLNENALMAVLYLEAYQASGRPRYAAVARGILDDLLERFRLPGGGFATALDADSGEIEGVFYTWTTEEVRAVLGEAQAAPFLSDYLDSEHGLLKGRAVLRIRREPAAFLDIQTRHSKNLQRLRAARARRPAPLSDDKVLTSWTALAVSAFAKAAQVLGEERYYQVAIQEAEQLMASVNANGRLVHSRRGEVLGEDVFLDDYSFLAQALIDLFETDFDPEHLDRALALMEDAFTLFQAETGALFQFTPIDRDSDIPTRVILDEIGTPSGNAIAMSALYRLRLFGADEAFARRAEEVALELASHFETSAGSVTGSLNGLSFRSNEAREIVIVGRLQDDATQDLLREVRRRRLPGTVLAVIPEDAPQLDGDWILLSGRPLLDNRPTAYICRNRLCNFPVNSVDAFAMQLDAINHQTAR